MKQNIKFSAYSLIVAAVVLILCLVGIFSLIGNAEKLTRFCIIMGGATSRALLLPEIYSS
jgi:uncharacterized protein (UPF0333 family)